MNINIKILSYRDSQRYVVKQAVIAALEELRKKYPKLQLTITGIHDRSEMEKFTAIMILPSLVVNEKLVCVSRFPKKIEVVSWLEEAIKVLT